jgi:hypothetical protein
MLMMKVECYTSAAEKAIKAGDSATAARATADIKAAIQQAKELAERARAQ